MSPLAVYNGTHPKLILAFDVSGTTHSMISYCILMPGNSPQIKDVTKFPGQTLVQADRSMGDGYRSNWEVPMVMYYDQAGIMKAAGFEARLRNKDGTVTKEGWSEASFLRVQLQAEGPLESLRNYFPQPPPGKTSTVLFADFFSYLLLCAGLYIAEVEGQDIWDSAKKNIDPVLVIPNGWGEKEKKDLRVAAIRGGIVVNNLNPLRFVKKGEATLHFGSRSDRKLSILLKKGETVVIADMERLVMDVSVYEVNPRQLSDNTYEELVTPEVCADMDSAYNDPASMFVDVRERLMGYLKSSIFNQRELDIAINIATETMISEFKDVVKPLSIKFGSTHDVDRENGISDGRVRVDGRSWLAGKLESPIQSLVATIVKQSRHVLSEDIILVGTYANNDWIVSRVQELVKKERALTNVFRLEHHNEEIITSHGISFFLNHLMGIRVSEATYGVTRPHAYDGRFYEHKLRKPLSIIDAEGKTILMGGFFRILPMDTQVRKTEEFRGTFEQSFYRLSDLKQFSVDIWAYVDPTPSWKHHVWWDEDKEKYKYLCTINANDAGVKISLSPQKNANGETFYKLKFDVVISFGMDEMKAQIAWREKGVERRTPATMIEVYGSEDASSIQSAFDSKCITG